MSHDERINSHFQQIDYRRGMGDGQELLVKAYHKSCSARRRTGE